MPNKIRKFALQLFTWPIRYAIKLYLSKPRNFRYNNITGVVLPGVFHPGFFHSTKLLLEFLQQQDVSKKEFLELGCGSGFISILAVKKGALVTAIDINTKAIENVLLNAKQNQVEVTAFHSDLFNQIPERKWDWIVINPPYYPSDPTTEAEYAWYCGQEHQYFKKLFKSLANYIHSESRLLMILSEVCDLNKISEIALQNNFYFEKIAEKKVWVDGRNFLYWIKRSVG